MANNRFAIELLTPTLLLEITKYLSTCEIANVVMACIATLKQAKSLDLEGFYDKSLGINYSDGKLHPFFNSRIHTMQILKQALNQAGLYILTAQKDKALAIIDQYSELLLHVIPSIKLESDI